jgi:hypothetical protein
MKWTVQLLKKDHARKEFVIKKLAFALKTCITQHFKLEAFREKLVAQLA